RRAAGADPRTGQGAPMIDVEAANRTAVERMMASRPRLVGVDTARRAIPWLAAGRRLLHAGPPIAWERASGPLRGAVIGAALFEGWAAGEAEAEALAASGEVELAPCHDHAAVGPMAGVISPSMALYVVEDATDSHRTYSNLNEGYGKVLRYGAYAPEVLARLRWINGELAELLAAALAAPAAADGGDGEPLDLRALAAEALHMGDEGHNRNRAGSLLFVRWLAPRLVRAAPSAAAAERALVFLGDNALSVLNPLMAACKAMADAGHGVEGSTVVSAMARNGTDFGIRVGGLGARWFTAPATVPDGLYFSGFGPDDANPDIGDSTITETAGLGGFAMAAAPAIVTFVGGSPGDAVAATLEMYEITVAEHTAFTIPALGFRGTPVGIDVRKVVELGITPRVNTGIAHRLPGVGQVGAGLVRPPAAVFEDALYAWAERYLPEHHTEEES
ncbi:MAG TPA: DUF1116 domain-containing protein, partial [Thermoanaerobaculia bacterium]|nr:DUF1116 domain-containing protein [Thermoanaerobaculia bacterium]